MTPPTQSHFIQHKAAALPLFVLVKAFEPYYLMRMAACEWHKTTRALSCYFPDSDRKIAPHLFEEALRVARDAHFCRWGEFSTSGVEGGEQGGVGFVGPFLPVQFYEKHHEQDAIALHAHHEWEHCAHSVLSLVRKREKNQSLDFKDAACRPDLEFAKRHHLLRWGQYAEENLRLW